MGRQVDDDDGDGRLPLERFVDQVRLEVDRTLNAYRRPDTPAHDADEKVEVMWVLIAQCGTVTRLMEGKPLIMTSPTLPPSEIASYLQEVAIPTADHMENQIEQRVQDIGRQMSRQRPKKRGSRGNGGDETPH